MKRKGRPSTEDGDPIRITEDEINAWLGVSKPKPHNQKYCVNEAEGVRVA